MTIIDNAVYVDGVRTVDPVSLEQTFETLKERGGVAWIGLYRPTPDEISAVAQEFGLHSLAVEDAVQAHQRPKLERYDDHLFTVLRPSRYLDKQEMVEIGELHIFTGPDFVITIRHAETASVAQVRNRLESSPELLRLGPEAVLYALLDQVVDDYAPVLAGLENDIDEIEDQLFSGDSGVSRRIYELSREVMEFHRAVHPLLPLIESLSRGFEKYGVDVELQHYLRDVQDHATQVNSRVETFRQTLQDALLVDSTLTAARQNDQMKKISSWAAILFAPTAVGSIYGMNFRHMPELDWPFGYPMALGLMLLIVILLYGMFRRRGWL